MLMAAEKNLEPMVIFCITIGPKSFSAAIIIP